jgi:membrane protease YdiL (CAAX protease family)
LWAEVGAVLAVGVVPNLISAIPSTVSPPPSHSYLTEGLILTAYSACTAYVVYYLIVRSGESTAHFGLGSPYLIAVLGLPLILLAFDYHMAQLVYKFVPFDSDQLRQYSKPTSTWDFIVMAVKNGANGVAEELVTRAYLITRLAELLRSRGEAVVFSAGLFASYHCYQGGAGVIIAFVFGLAFGITYLCYRNVWPLVVAHTVINIHIEWLSF